MVTLIKMPSIHMYFYEISNFQIIYNILTDIHPVPYKIRKIRKFHLTKRICFCLEKREPREPMEIMNRNQRRRE